MEPSFVFVCDSNTKKNSGFTLIELLIVIVIVGILAVGAFVALDPATRFAEARNATRWNDVTAVLEAIKIYEVDNAGASAYSGVTTDGTNYMIGTPQGPCAATCSAASVASDCIDMGNLVTEGLLASVPTDPSSGTAATTGYYISESSTGAITIGACEPEVNDTISVQR